MSVILGVGGVALFFFAMYSLTQFLNCRDATDKYYETLPAIPGVAQVAKVILYVIATPFVLLERSAVWLYPELPSPPPSGSAHPQHGDHGPDRPKDDPWEKFRREAFDEAFEREQAKKKEKWPTNTPTP